MTTPPGFSVAGKRPGVLPLSCPDLAQRLSCPVYLPSLPLMNYPSRAGDLRPLRDLFADLPETESAKPLTTLYEKNRLTTRRT